MSKIVGGANNIEMKAGSNENTVNIRQKFKDAKCGFITIFLIYRFCMKCLNLQEGSGAEL